MAVYTMARRKARPLVVVAFITVFLLFTLFRGRERELFTFDSLPPYTDNEHYVKKPEPPKMPWTEPPPPPPEWGQSRNPQGKHEYKPIQAPPYLEPQQPLSPGRATKEKPKEQSKDRPAQDNVRASKPDTSNLQEDKPLLDTPRTTFDQHPQRPSDRENMDQPPTSGDYHRLPAGTLYTPEELAPRIQKYPIPPNEIIQLPKRRPNTLPKVQARFSSESAERKRIRQQRQAAIKRAMVRSWDAYSSHAMGHDELRPVSGRRYNPFCGWGATLVDSLDTLQIMGMQAEYEEALKWIAEIDFAHTHSYQIPLFETVIRYLGGLIGAYDVSGRKDRILLDKAKDLADMLMGAFDTHNHMPLLRYDWRPQASRQNLRANDNSCLAELGTLTLEFTRLAQLTGNHTYYDAVQRITDGFEDFKFSHVPGLYPLHVDASGCKYEDASIPETSQQIIEAPLSNQPQQDTDSQFNKRAAIDAHDHPRDESHLEDPGRAQMGNAMRESLNEAGSTLLGQPSGQFDQVQAAPKCERQGLIPSIWRSNQEFSVGGEADSTYEYFLKEHILLGAAKEQYKNLYLASVDAAEKFLFYRPLVEGDPDILFSGRYVTTYNDDGTMANGWLVGEMQHLTCFVGGMLAMGSKIFNRPHDLLLAEKMTDGCVWAYNATETGIMPESFEVHVCDETPCHWVSPQRTEPAPPPPEPLPKLDEQDYQAQDDNLIRPGDYGEHRNSDLKKRAPEPDPQRDARQGPPLPEPPHSNDGEPIQVHVGPHPTDIDPEVEQLALARQQQSHIHKVNHPPSFIGGMDRRYILRPEAIESVFYMWRITGDPEWQEKGWRMWESIEEATRTDLAYSAIKDVNDKNSDKADSMESFWLAETLKYFYLLYSEPSLMSLDEWVFNTEAHPFKRPDLGER